MGKILPRISSLRTRAGWHGQLSCACAHIHTHTHTHISTRTHARINTQTNIHTHARTRACVSTSKSTSTHTHTHKHAHTHTHPHTSTHIHTFTHTHTHTPWHTTRVCARVRARTHACARVRARAHIQSRARHSGARRCTRAHDTLVREGSLARFHSRGQRRTPRGTHRMIPLPAPDGSAPPPREAATAGAVRSSPVSCTAQADPARVLSSTRTLCRFSASGRAAWAYSEGLCSI